MNYQVPQQVQQLIEAGALFFCSHSGGKDSQAMYLLLSQIVPADQLIIVHADLGEIEWDGVKAHILGNIDGRNLEIATAIHKDGSLKDFFSLVRARRAYLDSLGKFDTPAVPDSKNRFCTSDLKTGPIFKVIRRIAKERGATQVVNCLGLRAGESDSRAKKETWKVEKKLATKSRDAWTWLPIHDWTCSTDKVVVEGATEVFQVIRESGQEPHPAYAKNDRLSCVFCIFGSRNDLRHGALKRPDLYRKYIELEHDVRSTLFNGESLQERAGIRLIAKAA